MLAAFLLLAATAPVFAIKIKLSNGTTFNGNLASQNDNYVIMEIGGSKLSIAKTMIVAVEGLPPGVTITNTGSPAPAPSQSQAVTQPAAPPQSPAAADTVFGSAQNKPVEITLKNGVKYKGVIVSETENMITLQDENGSRATIYKNIIAEIPGRQVFAPVPAPAVEPPKTVPPPGASPVTDQQTTAPKQAIEGEARPSIPAVNQSKAEERPPVARSMPPETSPLEKTPEAPLSTPVPVVTQPAAAVPAAPAPRPVIAPPVQAAPPAPAAVAPSKRPDGKHEILLKTGTVFVGTIVSENDRFLSFSTKEGTTINILKRLIRKLDGVPYVMNEAAASPMDTSSQLKKTALTSAVGTGKGTTALEKTGEAKPSVIKRRMMPVIAIKPGVSMAELMDSLKSTYRDQRAVSARQIGTMGQWATGAISALVARLGDTAGAQEFPSPETDSVTREKLLPPGFEAARALSRIGPEAIDELKRGTRSGNMLVRERSVFGCGEAQDIGLLPTLQQALKDDDPHVRAIAAHGLRFNDASDALVRSLGDLDGDVRTFAAATLGELRNPGAVKPLIAALKDVRPSVRAQAAIALGRVGVKEAIAPVAELVNDMTPQVREKGAIALGMFKDSTAVPPLLIAITDVDPHVRTAAAQALGELRDPRAIPSLYSAMQEKNDTVRTAVESALKQLTEIPLLIAALDDENSLVRENAAYILWLMTGTDLGQDKKAWTEWFADQGKAPVKKVEPEKMDKGEKKKK